MTAPSRSSAASYFALGLVLASGLFLSGCAEGGEDELDCDMDPSASSIRAVLESHSDCSACLLKEVDEASSGCPDRRPLQLLGFYSAYQAGEYSRAAAYYENMLESGNASSSEHADAGYVYQKLGRGSSAIRSFELAIGSASGSEPMLEYELAVLYVEENRYDEAISVLKRIVDNNRPHREVGRIQVIGDDAIYDEAAIALGNAYAELRMFEDAEKVYLDLLSVYPDDAEAKASLAQLKAEQQVLETPPR